MKSDEILTALNYKSKELEETLKKETPLNHDDIFKNNLLKLRKTIDTILKEHYPDCTLCKDEKFIEDKTCPAADGGYRIEPCPKCNGDGS